MISLKRCLINSLKIGVLSFTVVFPLSLQAQDSAQAPQTRQDCIVDKGDEFNAASIQDKINQCDEVTVNPREISLDNPLSIVKRGSSEKPFKFRATGGSVTLVQSPGIELDEILFIKDSNVEVIGFNITGATKFRVVIEGSTVTFKRMTIGRISTGGAIIRPEGHGIQISGEAGRSSITLDSVWILGNKGCGINIEEPPDEMKIEIKGADNKIANNKIANIGGNYCVTRLLPGGTSQLTRKPVPPEWGRINEITVGTGPILDFNNIQEAVSSAESEGDKIILSRETFRGDVKIDRSIALKGLEKAASVVNGQITVASFGGKAEIRDLTIQNPEGKGIGIQIAKNVSGQRLTITIDNVSVKRNSVGINADDAQNTTIEINNSDIEGNDGNGLSLVGTRQDDQGNDQQSLRVNISNSRIVRNGNLGIEIRAAGNITLSKSVIIEGNGSDGIRLTGNSTLDLKATTEQSLRVVANKGSGIRIKDASKASLDAEGTASLREGEYLIIIERNDKGGIIVSDEATLSLADSAQSSIRFINIIGNGQEGVFVGGCANATIRNAKISNDIQGFDPNKVPVPQTRNNGILLQVPSAEDKQQKRCGDKKLTVTIENNEITRNEDWGVAAVMWGCFPPGTPGRVPQHIFRERSSISIDLKSNEISENKKGQVCLPDVNVK